MKKLSILSVFMLLIIFVPIFAQPVTALPSNNFKSMNKEFLKFQEKSDVIHVFVFDDDGRPGQPAA
ncbi:MAG: hypothetical protein ACFFCZ_13720, partial [Promethearchaeota archaeon]